MGQCSGCSIDRSAVANRDKCSLDAAQIKRTGASVTASHRAKCDMTELCTTRENVWLSPSEAIAGF